MELGAAWARSVKGPKKKQNKNGGVFSSPRARCVVLLLLFFFSFSCFFCYSFPCSFLLIFFVQWCRVFRWFVAAMFFLPSFWAIYFHLLVCCALLVRTRSLFGRFQEVQDVRNDRNWAVLFFKDVIPWLFFISIRRSDDLRDSHLANY